MEEVSSDRIVDISHRKPIKRYYLARHTHQGGFNLDKIIANKDSSDRGHESLLRNDDDFFDSMYPNSSNAHQLSSPYKSGQSLIKPMDDVNIMALSSPYKSG